MEERVLFVVRMPCGAVCLSRVPRCGRLAPKYVLGASDYFHVGWVDTGRITAQMVNREAIGDRPDIEFVAHTMREQGSTVAPT